MLRLSAPAWRLARKLSHASACGGGGGLRSALALRSFSSTPVEGGAGTLDGLKVVKNNHKVTAGPTAWEQKTLTALQAYKNLHGDLLVPRPFVVPDGNKSWPSVAWGYRLGTAVNRLRARAKNKSLSPRMDEELGKMGFIMNAPRYKWESIILPALRQFRNVHNHTDVPAGFVVPTGDDAWPELAWGHRLGNTVHDIRHRNFYAAQVTKCKKELDKMEFCIDMSIVERDWEEKILPSIRVYHQEFGDCIIPQLFVVPSSAPWPEKAWGKPLGIITRDIRQGSSYAEQVVRDKGELDAVGFAWDRSTAVWNEMILPAIATHANVYKTGHVSYGFVVPAEDPWPKKAWGKKLGATLSVMRGQGTYFAHYGRDIDKLNELGANLKLLPRAWNKRVAPLLTTYAELHGPGEVPEDFVVPSEAPWEKKMWGVRLGLNVARNTQFGPR